MDRAEGALRVAERALAEAKRARDDLAALMANLPKVPSGLFVDDGGHLVAVYHDGSQSKVGRVRGCDGPAGPSGRDGLGFDDLSIIYDGERTFTLRCAQGERVKEQSFTVPIVLDRGVWRDGAYLRGDAVTHGGSIWIAKDDTSGMPGVSTDWRLAVKRGRDGKAGANGKDGIIGPKGDRGDQGPRGFGG